MVVCLPSNIAEVIVFNDPIISNQPITSQTLCQMQLQHCCLELEGMAHLVINGTAIHQILILEVSQ
jgi:hypothetical protein